ncbi:MAG: small subunit ribosomal protein [Candidatus Woesearchaeota archaeon]|nr:small subunit ribosomal protein [Candidatus Woesearchaeota archaeon]MDN5327996.1 small subunit ribosomal protein [Candidatus Woesearchaeota archaeon]
MSKKESSQDPKKKKQFKNASKEVKKEAREETKVKEPVQEETVETFEESTEELTEEADNVEETDEEIVADEEVVEEVTKSPEGFESWVPKTRLGKLVKEGVINNIDEILSKGYRILEPEIVDYLLPNLEKELILVGQAKGKFGGGSRRVFRQTQKKTAEGNKPKFSTAAVCGDMNGHVGIGFGKSKDTVPAREKAIKQSKLNIIKIKRGCGSWECACGEPHSIPFKVSGKCGSVKVEILPAPKGKGIVAEKEIQKVLKLAGITDVWVNSTGQSRKKINLIKATFEALKQLSKIKVFDEEQIKSLGIVDGAKPQKIEEKN